jgi:Leucine-rich repeat (LRR) protein
MAANEITDTVDIILHYPDNTTDTMHVNKYIEKLDLKNRKLVKIELPHLCILKWIAIDNNFFTSLDNIIGLNSKNLPELRYIGLNNNEITSLKIPYLPELQRIDIINNKINSAKKITGLNSKKLPNFWAIHIAGNPIPKKDLKNLFYKQYMVIQ